MRTPLNLLETGHVKLEYKPVQKAWGGQWTIPSNRLSYRKKEKKNVHLSASGWIRTRERDER